MLLILLYWVFVTLSFLGTGTLLGLSVSKKTDILQVIGYGMIIQTLLCSIVCFFLPLNHELITLCLSTTAVVGVVVVIRKRDVSIFQKISNQKNIFFFTGIALLAALQSTHMPSFPDHDSYYIPTVRWAQEFGYVKGLVNWHYFLGQFSSWHILYAAHDALLPMQVFGLNAWLLLWGGFCMFHKNKNPSITSLSTLMLYFIFGWVFIDGISPDITVYVVMFIIFHEIRTSKEMSLFCGVLIIWVVLIKIIYAPLLLLLFLTKKHWVSLSVLLFTSFGVMASKNYILTGFPTYPLSFAFGNTPDWAMPAELFSLIQNQSNGVLFIIFQETTLNVTLLEWIAFGVLLSLLLLSLIMERNTKMRYFWGILTVYILVMSLFSIQFRFIYFVVPIAITPLLNLLVSRYNIPKYITLPIVITPILFLFLFQAIPSLSRRAINANQLLIPQKKIYEYRLIKSNSIDYYTPKSPSFFYEIGDLPLPSNSHYWLQHLKKKHHLQPVTRDKDIKNGFRMKYVEDNE